MKKIYSFLLIATALLFSTNLKATTEADLVTLFSNGGSLTLTSDVSLTAPLRLYVAHEYDNGKTINLDLGGYTITFNSQIGIELFKGTLNITGSGYLQNAYQPEKNTASYVIMVYGHHDENTADWSTLTIGENVNIQNDAKFNDTPTGVGVAVDAFGLINKYYSWAVDPTEIPEGMTNLNSFDGEHLNAGDIIPAYDNNNGYWKACYNGTTLAWVDTLYDYSAQSTEGRKWYYKKGLTSANTAMQYMYNWKFATTGINATAYSEGLVDYHTAIAKVTSAAPILFKTSTVTADSVTHGTSSSYDRHNYFAAGTYLTNVASVTNGVDTLKGFESIEEIDRKYITSKGVNSTNGKRYIPRNPTLYPVVEASFYGYAYGAVINVEGSVYGSKYGVKANGYLVGTGANAPKINLLSTSDVTASASSTKSVAVYASGFGSWNIEGNVEGANGVYVKSGKVEIENATIASNYTGTPQDVYGKSSGVDVGGMAICIESNDSYAGGQEVTISGDSKVTAGTNGAAILEKIATNDDESKVSNITINGGTFEGGKEGSIIIEDDTKENTVIYGANVAVAEGGDQTDTDIQNLLEQLKPVGTTVVEVEDAQGHTTYVVTEFDGQAPTATPFTISANNDEDNRADFDLSGLDLSLANDFAIGDVEGNSPENIYLGAVILNHATGITINVNKNSTLTVKSLVMGVNDVINVEPGAKLIVDGEQGINAPVNGNIIVKAKGDEMGEFYFNPTVNSNKHPKATVELNAKAYNNGSTYYYQRCGVPAFEGIHPSDIQKTYGASYWYWNTEISDWVNLAVADWSTFTFEPFQGFQVTSAATAEYQETYKFPVNLYGNVDGAIKYQAGWNYLANSYTGGMDVAAMLTDILSKDVLEAGVYAYTPNANTKDTWDLISALDIADGEAKQSKLDPMQAFVCRNKTGVEYTDAVNYKNVVWNHRTEAKVTMAPARRTALAWDKVKVVVTSNDFSQAVTLRQSAQFSADYDNGGDITAFENGTFNVYAVTELGNLAQVATDYLIGQTLTIDTKNAKSFKMTFENLNGETFAIRDNVTGSVIDMTEGAEYYFTADAYNGENRFEIVEARKMPTDVEVVDAAKAQKGIYSLVGAYLGEDFDVLPAGIYVVNGVKVVK